MIQLYQSVSMSQRRIPGFPASLPPCLRNDSDCMLTFVPPFFQILEFTAPTTGPFC